MVGGHSTTWRTSPARIAEEHSLHIAQLEADATRAAWRETAYAVALRHHLATTQQKGT